MSDDDVYEAVLLAAERYIAKHDPACGDLLRRRRLGEIEHAELVRSIGEMQAKSLIADPPKPHPYPSVVCSTRNRLAALPNFDSRCRELQKGEPPIDLDELIIGRKQHQAWYARVCEDLETYAETIADIGLTHPLARKLASALLVLAMAYQRETGVRWRADRESGSGSPQTTPAHYAQIARGWLNARHPSPRPGQLAFVDPGAD